MLEFYFPSAHRVQLLRRGPLVDHLDDLAALLRRQAYAATTARRILSVAGQFSHYLALTRTPLAAVTDRCVAAFFDDHLASEGLFRDGQKVLVHVLPFLRSVGVLPPARVKRVRPHPCAGVLTAFDQYLDRVRGLRGSTRKRHGVAARQFLDWLRRRHRGHWRRVVAGDVLAYITETLESRRSRSARAHVCSDVRTFLRYLHASRALVHDLTYAVPSVAHPRLASVPPRLAWTQVRALIDSIDATRPVGMRDKAIILLLATLGLRAYEVRALELGDIRWRVGEICVRRTKTRRERVVPLLQEVGAALAEYILHGRPPLDVPQVFLRHIAPPGPMTCPNSVVYLVRRRLKDAGIERARGGAHMLRHSLATQMVNAGVAIKSVADVLGHASIDSTAVYTKVDLATLGRVALPFPGGVQ